MRSSIEQELLDLARNQVGLCHFLETRLRNAISSMSSQTPQLRRLRGACRTEARAWKERIQEECVRFLETFRPPSIHLRQIANVLDSVHTLLNVAEMTDQIEECGSELSFIPDAVVPAALFPITLDTTRLLRSALAASWNRPVGSTRDLTAEAAVIRDRLHDLLRELYGHLRENPHTSDVLLPLHRVIHCLAGIADLAEDLLPGVFSDANRASSEHHLERLAEFVSVRGSVSAHQ